jgi:flagellar hook-length control protein FliK
MPVQPTMGPMVADKPALTAAGHGTSSAGTSSFLGSLEPLLTARPPGLPQGHAEQPVTSPVAQGKTSQNGAEAGPSGAQASEKAPPAPANQNREVAIPIPAPEPYAVASVANASTKQSGAFTTEAAVDTNEQLAEPRSAQRLGGAFRLAGRKPDEASRQSDSAVCMLSTPIQSLPDALSSSPKALEPQVGQQPAQTSSDQPGPVRCRARGNEVVASADSSPAASRSETTAHNDTKVGQPDMPAAASPAPPLSASKASEPTITLPTSMLMPQPAPTPTTATPIASAQAHTGSGTVLSTAAQIAPAIVSLATTTSGTQQLTVRLDPEELGRVEIRIEQPQEGAAHVTVIVDRPETLNLLLRDEPQLQHALNQAGIPVEGRAVTFHVASADPSAGSNQYAPSPDTGAGGMQANAGGSHREQRSARPSKTADNDPLAPIASAASFSVSQVRLGLDITA